MGDDNEKWKKGLRARVTALKCHVMASHGLTPQGHIVPAYSPEVIMNDPNNAEILQKYNKPKEIKAYIASALQKNSKSMNSSSEIDANDIQVEFEDSSNIVPENAWPPIEETNSVVGPKIHTSKNQYHNGSPCGKGSSNLSRIICGNEEIKGLDFWQNAESEDEDQDSPVANGYTRINANDAEFGDPESPTKTDDTIPSFIDPRTENKEKDEIISVNNLSNLKEAIEYEQCNHKYEIQELKRKICKQEQQIEHLGNIRDEVENELQELTANLFQEAHSMVTAANLRTAAAEKTLAESKMAVEVLTGEVTALKAMVMTSTPAAPNVHLHQQLQTSSSTTSNNNPQQESATSSTSASLTSNSSNSLPVNISGLRIFQRGHKKSPSDFDLKYGRDNTPPSSPFKECTAVGSTVIDCWEVDPVCHKEFVSWQQTGEFFDVTHPFLRRVYDEEMSLCLSFSNEGLSHAVEKAVRANDIFIEEVNARHQHTVSQKCVLLEVARFCKYRFRLGSKQPFSWYYISQLARNRIIAVCDFLNYLRYIKQGLVKSSIHDMYWEIVKLRRQMSLARLGF